MGVMFARSLLILAALMLLEPSVRAAPSSVTSGLTARQLSSDECNRVCEGPTKEYYEGKGCSVPESLSTCCTDQFISDYVQCNVCRRNNDQNSPDYPGIQATLNIQPSPTSTSEGKSTVSDPAKGSVGQAFSDGAVAGGGGPRPTDQSRVSEQQRAGNSAQSIIPAQIWSPREGSLQKALAITNGTRGSC
ncbi:hypothetical protein FA13DRAFT_1731542 [Coprinellus micaceus]|uniref:Uncharacterized protein n=1 Tax=Coprinellus micaceus TaxID=71717 RepID=A0A4Y7TFQ5_COPMI|nr:hypothetical protein FA13DRAFT_1731542 [Coprinellus micaceus]